VKNKFEEKSSSHQLSTFQTRTTSDGSIGNDIPALPELNPNQNLLLVTETEVDFVKMINMPIKTKKGVSQRDTAPNS
jgi:hypothetical protein